jgi:hypothetical protein
VDTDWKEIGKKLSAPFHPDELEFRVGNVARSGKSATVLTYLTSRAVMDRLDEVVGPDNWRDEYTAAPDGGLMCGLSLRVSGEWVTKYDAAENTKVEAVKGGFSGALKRAAVKWGIGRYLYFLDTGFNRIVDGWADGHYEVNVSNQGKHLGKLMVQRLPAWAEPGGSGRPSQNFGASPKSDTEQRRRAVDPPLVTRMAPRKDEPEMAKPGTTVQKVQMAGTSYPFNTMTEEEAESYRKWNRAERSAVWGDIKGEFFSVLARHGVKYDRPAKPGLDGLKVYCWKQRWPKPSSVNETRLRAFMAGVSNGKIKPPGWHPYEEKAWPTPDGLADAPPMAPPADLDMSSVPI